MYNHSCEVMHQCGENKSADARAADVNHNLTSVCLWPTPPPNNTDPTTVQRKPQQSDELL